VARAVAYLLANFHLDPCNHLATIHQRHRETDRQDRWDRQWSDIIGRTVLQTVAQETRVRVKMQKMMKVKLLSSFCEITFFIANIVRTKHHTAMSHLRLFAIFATPTNNMAHP